MASDCRKELGSFGELSHPDAAYVTYESFKIEGKAYSEGSEEVFYPEEFCVPHFKAAGGCHGSLLKEPILVTAKGAPDNSVKVNF